MNLRFPQALKRLGLAIAGMLVFVLGLWMLRESALSLKPLLIRLRVSGVVNAVGAGWLMAHLILSGSPVAAMSLTLFSGHVLSGMETFAMINGSRLGSSFIVLFVGFLYWLRGQQRAASISIGVLSFMVTASVYLPAMALGSLLLNNSWLNHLRFGSAGQAVSIIEWVYGPLIRFLIKQVGLPQFTLFALGVGILLAAFNLFDKALPEIDAESGRLSHIAESVYRPIFMFLLGAGITSITLSVSVSLGLLVPLNTRGYVRRENIIPYIMGANITTFIDTLLAAMLIPSQPGEPMAFTIVLVQMISVTLISMLIMVLNYSFYQRLMDRMLEWVMHDNRRLGIFLGMISVIPIILLLV